MEWYIVCIHFIVKKRQKERETCNIWSYAPLQSFFHVAFSGYAIKNDSMSKLNFKCFKQYWVKYIYNFVWDFFLCDARKYSCNAFVLYKTKSQTEVWMLISKAWCCLSPGTLPLMELHYSLSLLLLAS